VNRAIAEDDRGHEVSFPSFEGETVRERLVAALRHDLLGPEDNHESLSQSPATRYLIGMLAPHNTEVDATEDDLSENGGGAEEGVEEPPPISLTMAPSSIGLSFVASRDAQLTLICEWGEYAQDKASGGDSKDSLDDGSEADAATHKKGTRTIWARTHHRETIPLVPLSEGRSTPVFVGVDVKAEWLVRALGEKVVVSVFLTNARTAPRHKRPPDDMWLYQPRLEVRASAPEIEARRIPKTHADPDPDVASADLTYRDRLEFAAGHGVSAGWPETKKDKVDAVWTEILPQREVPLISADVLGLPDLDMRRLGAATRIQVVNEIAAPLLDAYSQWIDQRAAETAALDHASAAVALDHIQLAKDSLLRMRQGLELLNRDGPALQAFAFANRAVAMQREASVRVLSFRRKQPSPSVIPTVWRPFQLGFLLQCLASIADPRHADRRIADLLWFPTGGGKTEAYLGLTAFALAIRRLRDDNGSLSNAAGTSVLMRYTLRLLTIQQFQRASALLCACEVIRREETKLWGEEPFRIGLWVGGSVTPNSYDDSKAALIKLKNSQRVYEGSPYQVLYCPWCGTDISPQNYVCDDDLRRTLIKCPNDSCAFSWNTPEGLPLLLVDEEIYRNPPGLLLATVDKFAQMAWNGRIQSLFGRVQRKCPRHGFISAGDDHPKKHDETKGYPESVVRLVDKPLAPPDLIIQDELHLISGPLGTLVGIYEAAVETLCTRVEGAKRIRPKVIASTATIRRASHQVLALFDRDVAVFPAQGLTVDDTFFGRVDRTKPGRLYVGVFAPGKSVKTTLVRTYAALLSRAEFEYSRVGTKADPYMTLVGYFNSLRELGGALRLIDDDIPARLRVLRRRGFGPSRLIREKKELTSRARTYEIAETLKQLDRTFAEHESGAYPLDVLLASNMLSVGVDIDRLGLMVVSAQPKTSAEYIQATSRVGRQHPGLVVEVYNWVRPRDISHYERFRHYHDTFYRHVEATSTTPFSSRARDRALPAVLTSYMRQNDPDLSSEQDADRFRRTLSGLTEIAGEIAARAQRTTGRTELQVETAQQILNLADEWDRLTSARAKRPLVYTGRGLKGNDQTKTVLLRPMERDNARGAWKAAGSLREVEPDVPVVLIP
jgi:hypothetical protein